MLNVNDSYHPALPDRNQADVTYSRPLFQHAVVATIHFPTHVTADVAYDNWYVYETVARPSGHRRHLAQYSRP